MDGSEVNVCLAGYGNWGRNLARNFASLGALYAVCESDGGRRSAAAAQYPAAKTFARLEEVLDDPAVQAVAIASPAEQHFRMVMAALRAGKHVFVEKPLALQWTEGSEMVRQARAAGRLLMVGHLLRYHPAVAKIRELLDAGVLGRIDYIYSNRLSMGKIRQEENALWSFAPHDISVVLALMGRLPVQVVATGGAYLQPNIADVTVSQLLFDNGARCHIFVSWLHPYKEQRLVVIGSKQMVVFEDTRPDNKLLLFNQRIEWKNGAPEAGKPQGVPVAFSAEEPLRQECAHFIECVAGGLEPHTPGEEGLAVLQVLGACQRSLQMSGQPVALETSAFHKVLQL